MDKRLFVFMKHGEKARTLDTKKEKFHRLISWQNPFKVKIIPQKSDSFNPVPAASTVGPCPAITGLLLRFYDNVQTEWQQCSP